MLLIVVDTLRADHLSAYGYGRKTSPFLDSLAAQGTLYEHAISAASWTLPAHASLFTGLYPRDHGTTSNHWTLDPRFATLAERLRGAGYHTGGFSNNVWVGDVSKLDRGFDTFLELWREREARKKEKPPNEPADDPTSDMGAARTTGEILAWIDGLEDERPFFVFVNYFEPHLPYRPTEPYDDDFLPEGVDVNTVKRLRSFHKPREYGYILRAPWIKVSDRDLEVLTALYDAEIAYVDSQIERLVAGLRSRNRLEDTVLVITSDHGDHLGENHMLDHKFSVYEPLLRVPLILWGPGLVPVDRRIESQVQVHRLFGTLLEMAQVGGSDALPSERPLAGPRYTFAELDYPEIFLEVARQEMAGWNVDSVARALTAVRGPRYKLISGSDGTVELYDLTSDPLEARNLAGSHPDTVAEMRKVLVGFRERVLPGRPER